MNLVGAGGKAPESSWILGFLILKSIIIMLYLISNSFIIHKIEVNIAVCLFFQVKI
jgi:hypothetical protein